MIATRFTRVVAAMTASAFLLAGCASIFAGTSQKFDIKSQPDSANIEIRDENQNVVFTGTTPDTVKLKKKQAYFVAKEYEVKIEKPGYKPVTITLRPSGGGWYIAGNAFIGGLIGWLIVDPLTGAMWTYRPKEIDKALERQVSELDEDTISVVLLEDVPAERRDEMVRIN